MRRDDEFVKDLFDKMGPTYPLMNLVSSFGFSEIWRYACVKNARIRPQSLVCDMMAGAGECWRYIPRDVAGIVSIDFSAYMVGQQRKRASTSRRGITVLEENCSATSLLDGSVDHVVCAYGLKTLTSESARQFFTEVARILRPGGTFSFLEISLPKFRPLRWFYEGYLSRVIPVIGKVLLGDVDCYRMLGKYTGAFGSCASLREEIKQAGLQAELRPHFFGCATSLMGTKLFPPTI